MSSPEALSGSPGGGGPENSTKAIQLPTHSPATSKNTTTSRPTASFWNSIPKYPSFVHLLPDKPAGYIPDSLLLVAREGHFAIFVGRSDGDCYGSILKGVNDGNYDDLADRRWVGTRSPFGENESQTDGTVTIETMTFKDDVGSLLAIISRRSQDLYAEFYIASWETEEAGSQFQVLSPKLRSNGENVNALSPDGCLFAYESPDGIDIFDVKNKRNVSGFINFLHGRRGVGLTWSQSCDKLLFCSKDVGESSNINGHIEIYNLTDGSATFRSTFQELSFHQIHTLNSVAFHFSGLDNHIEFIRPCGSGSKSGLSRLLPATKKITKLSAGQAFWGVIDSEGRRISLKEVGKEGEQILNSPIFSSDGSCCLGYDQSDSRLQLLKWSTKGARAFDFPKNYYASRAYAFDQEGQWILGLREPNGADKRFIELHVWESGS
ncbi:hypothetical protein TWF718_005212 [Orbilia javanica]|uniref:Uncharacterized protein n=1 Tax=Orbilia javanica TaxID=47235 RepID=A0AAN8MPM8_9PEZI